MRIQMRSIHAAVLLAMVAGMPLSGMADEAVQRIVSAKALRVAADPDSPPMLFADKNNKMEGFEWILANAIAKVIGVKEVKIVGGKYGELPGKLLAGQADVIIAGYTPDSSIGGVAWSDPYLEYGLCLSVRTGSPIKSIADLNGKKVGIFNDPAAEAAVKSLVSGYASLEKFDNGYFELLDKGKIDAFIYDYPFAQREIAKFAPRLKMVQFNLTKSTYNVGVAKEATGLLELVNAAIRGFKDSEEYKMAIRKYLGGSTAAPIDKDRASAARQTIHKVLSGESLSAIAKKELGAVNRWSEIWELNRQRIAEPNLIQAGWELLIPAKEKK